ncbi:MAG: glycosyltransferase family 2 protein [Nitrososphaerota archaeon]|nr:glycosyltransferase family 2 protein [Nitrososphaerota archaeon]
MDAVTLVLAAVGWVSGAVLFGTAAYSVALYALGSSVALEPRPAPDGPGVTAIVTSSGFSGALAETLRRTDEVDCPGLDILLALGGGHAGGDLKTAHQLEVFEPDAPGGKAHALNRAAERAKGEFLLLLDEDSRVDPDCVRNMLPCMQDERVWAVVGRPYPTNASGALQRTLEMEGSGWWAMSCARDRLGLLIPANGFFSLVRRSSLESPPGGDVWDEGALAEDTDLSLRQGARGLRTRVSPARVGIEAPSSLGALARQRLRWYKGMLDALWKNRGSVVRLPPMKAADVVLDLTSPLAPGAFVVLLLLSPLWPAFVLPVLLAAAALYLASAWVASSRVKEGRAGVLLYSVPYALVQGVVALAALGAFLFHVKIRWERTPKAGDAPAG